ncbi:MAG: hypothetical protein IKF01_04295 [Bacilli bacterium]|nr:hypothetical protein [Bacilli bacterium]
MKIEELLRLKRDFSRQSDHYKQSEVGKKELSKIQQLEFRHFIEAKKAIDKVLFLTFDVSPGTELTHLMELYSDNLSLPKEICDFLCQNSTFKDFYLSAIIKKVHDYFGTNYFSHNVFPTFGEKINLFNYFSESYNPFAKVYGENRDYFLDCFYIDLAKILCSCHLDSHFEREQLFKATNVRELLKAIEMTSNIDHSQNLEEQLKTCVDVKTLKKYIESLNPEVVFADNQTQEETVESISSENSELQQQISKIKNSHFPDEYKEQLIAELEQGDSQRGDGRTSGRSI